MPLLLMLWCNVVKRNWTHYINANGIIPMLTRNSPKTIVSITLVNADG